MRHGGQVADEPREPVAEAIGVGLRPVRRNVHRYLTHAVLQVLDGGVVGFRHMSLGVPVGHERIDLAQHLSEPLVRALRGSGVARDEPLDDAAGVPLRHTHVSMTPQD